MRPSSPRDCCHRDPGEVLTTTRGSALPFLPTLATALIVAAVPLLCRQPAEQAPSVPAMTVQAAAPGADGFHPARDAAATPVPAALAFARLHPLTLEAPALADSGEGARTATQRPARIAVTNRRPCAGPRCGEARRPDPVRSAVAAKQTPEPAVPHALRGEAETQDAETQTLLPDGALPFAPAAATAAAWTETVRKVGGSIGSLGDGAASLGGSVVDLIACAR